MRIVFMGTPDFALPSLRILLENNFLVTAVVTVPDKPQGRGQSVLPSPVKRFAQERKIPLLQPDSLKDERFAEQLRELNPDLFVVVAFRILPRSVFSLPNLGAFNLHASLLPKYRGAAPINWAIMNGEKETGVTTFFLEEKVDTGDIILQARLPVGADETYGELYTNLADIGAEIVLHSCRLIEAGKVPRRAQDTSLATPAPRIRKEDCLIDWTKPAQRVHNIIRGLSPNPSAFTHLRGRTLKIYRTRMTNQPTTAPPGSVVETSNRFLVAAGDETLEIVELQPESKRRMRADEFLRGAKLSVGENFS